MPTSARKSLFWLAALLLLVTWLGARRLNADTLFVDEYWSVRNAGGAYFGPLSPAGIWTQVADVDPGGVGVLYYWLLAGWGALVGWTNFAARAFSLAAGLLAVAWTYRLGHDLFSRRVGLYAAAIMGTSAFFVDYLHEMRAYTLYALFTAFTLWAYWRLVQSEKPPHYLYAALAAGLAALAYTHYIALVVGGAIGVYHLLFVPKNRRWWAILLAMAAAGILFLPWLSVTLYVVERGVGDTTRQSTSMGVGTAVQTLFDAFSNGNLALLALVAGYALLVRRRAAGFLWMAGFISLAAVLVVNALIPFLVHLRYLMVLWPILSVIAGLGVMRLAQTGLNPAFLLAVWLGAGVYQSFQPSFINDMFGTIYRAPWAGLSQGLELLRQRSHSDDLALFHISQPGFEPFNYFVMDYIMHGIAGRYDQIERMNNSFAKDDNTYLSDVNTVLAGAPRLWTLVVPEIPTTQRSTVVNYVLRDRYALCETLLDRPDLQMRLYVRAWEPFGGLAPFFYTTGTASGDEIRLFPVNTAPDSRDGMLHVLLGWRIDSAVPPDTYSVAVHVEDSSGTLVGQADEGLPNDRFFACSAVDIGLESLPPGEYRLLVAVYDWQTRQRLTGTVSATGQPADRLVVGEFSTADSESAAP